MRKTRGASQGLAKMGLRTPPPPPRGPATGVPTLSFRGKNLPRGAHPFPPLIGGRAGPSPLIGGVGPEARPRGWPLSMAADGALRHLLNTWRRPPFTQSATFPQPLGPGPSRGVHAPSPPHPFRLLNPGFERSPHPNRSSPPHPRSELRPPRGPRVRPARGCRHFASWQGSGRKKE